MGTETWKILYLGYISTFQDLFSYHRKITKEDNNAGFLDRYCGDTFIGEYTVLISINNRGI